VRAAGLNRAELRARNTERTSPLEFGRFINEYHEEHPKILGEEFVGEVEEAGADTSFKVGDIVAAWAYGGGKAYDGAYAEYTICHQRVCWKLPDTAREIPWEVLGAVPMSLWTAYGAIFEAGETKPGSTVFIHGATSSVGVWGILVCKDQGCTVIASTRQASKVQKLKDAGADYVVLEADLESSPETIRRIAPNGVDTVLEIIGIDAIKKISMPALAMHGTTVLMGILNKAWSIPDFDASFIPRTRKLTTFSPLEDDYDAAAQVLAKTVEKIRSGVYRKEVFLDTVFDLKDVGKAHQYMEENRAVGKLVLRI